MEEKIDLKVFGTAEWQAKTEVGCKERKLEKVACLDIVGSLAIND